ncbi:energy-coupling factor transporter ATPase [Staphylococcus succinus]|uniref:energy-coupling factor transporter ATPase n=1 Tax=Staphylococcus succinus TaxID=61015 RepID=UPI000D1D622C|nr:energy-coupling factor transporter ATPase [Staphylococcus succinus]PTI43901.1 energy-coupling factor transporter ATPase [Staphylococcus succinus]
MDTQENIIKFNHVSFKYNSDEPLALSDVSFDIPKGKWTSIVGHNGSGKSTIAKLMIGIESPAEGHIYFKDKCINKEDLNYLRKHIGIVFQNPENQFVGSTVEYDVAFGLENHAVAYEQMRELVPKALLDVDMLDRAEYEPQSLSGGQKQRVAIAGVLALNTDIIILDEATSMLDPAGRKELLTLIHQLKADNDVTIISITHDLSEAAEADHLVVLNEGTVFQTGLPQSIFNYADRLTDIGLDLPFSIRMNQYLSDTTEYITYEGLLKKL